MRRILAVALLAGCGLAGCGDNTSGPDDVLPASLTGTWVASSSCSGCSFVLTSVEDPSQQAELLSRGLTVRLELGASGSARLQMMGLESNGTARIAGGALILTGAGSADTIDYTVSGSTLDLRFRTPFTIEDLDGDGNPDQAHGRAVLRKE